MSKKVVVFIIFIVLVLSSCTNQKTEQVEKKGVAQSYIDAQKKNIENAKAAVDKSNKATEDALKQVDGLSGK